MAGGSRYVRPSSRTNARASTAVAIAPIVVTTIDTWAGRNVSASIRSLPVQ